MPASLCPESHIPSFSGLLNICQLCIFLHTAIILIGPAPGPQQLHALLQAGWVSAAGKLLRRKGLGADSQMDTWASSVPRWPRAPWPVSRVVWPVGVGKRLSCCTHHWWGCTLSTVSSSGSLASKRTLRCWSMSKEGHEDGEGSRRHVLWTAAAGSGVIMPGEKEVQDGLPEGSCSGVGGQSLLAYLR